MKVIIIGGIAAGMSAAAKLRRLDPQAEVIVYEKAPYISFGACGLPYYVGGFFEDENQMFARTPEAAEKSGICIKVEHEVLKVIPESKMVEVKNLKEGTIFTEHYDKLMIATGASAVIPPIKNLNIGNVHTLRSMADGNLLKEKMSQPEIKKIGIIGAGFIGIEVVEAAKKFIKETKYVGYANFDIKYDDDTKDFYFFEVNVRLGRSNFYMGAGNTNYLAPLVDSFIYDIHDKTYKQEGCELYSIIPFSIIKKYCKDKELVKVAKKLKKNNPLDYKKDFSLKRKYYIVGALINHIRKFRKYYE